MTSLALGIAVVVGVSASAQDSTRHRGVVRNAESQARATWQPVRRESGESAAEKAEKGSAHSGSASNSGTAVRHGNVRRTQHESAETLPSPTRGPRSVVEGSGPNGREVRSGEVIHGDVYPGEVIYDDGDYLDGQVVLHPFHNDSFGCDAMPHGGCGVDGGCDGWCGDAACGGHAWRPCITLCVPQNGWVSFEYLAWWQDGMSLPPLVTSNVGTGIPGTDAGVLGRGSTVTLFGGNRVLREAFDGGRLRFGVWLDRRQTWGLGAEVFSLGTESEGFERTSSGNPILARPFFNTRLGREDSELVAFPGVISGTVAATAQSQLDGWGVHFRRLRNSRDGCSTPLFCSVPESFHDRTEFLFGYRGLQLDERVTIREDLVSSAQERFDMFDRFDTRSQFNGIDIGWAHRRTRGYWTLDGAIRLAFGNTRQTVTIDGQTTIVDPLDPPAQTLPGGLLAQQSNIGTYRQDRFSVVPEINANLGFHLTDHLTLRVGYTFIYWSNIVRPGEHISRDVNPDLLPPPADPVNGGLRPEFRWDTVDYWVQGINFGGEYRW